QCGGCAVDGVLAGDPAAWTRSGSEDDGVGPAQFRDEIVRTALLEVGDHSRGANRGEIAGLIGVADQPDRLVSAQRQQTLQPHRDLTVSASNDHSHARHRSRSSGADRASGPQNSPGEVVRRRCRRRWAVVRGTLKRSTFPAFRARLLTFSVPRGHVERAKWPLLTLLVRPAGRRTCRARRWSSRPPRYVRW